MVWAAEARFAGSPAEDSWYGEPARCCPLRVLHFVPAAPPRSGTPVTTPEGCGSAASPAIALLVSPADPELLAMGREAGSLMGPVEAGRCGSGQIDLCLHDTLDLQLRDIIDLS